MKKLLVRFLILSIIIGIYVPVSAANKYENMFVNGGFEESLNNGWYKERGADYLRVKDNPHSGEYCVKNVKDYAGERYCQDFVLVPGETYDLSFWARTGKGNGEAMVGVSMRYGYTTDENWDPEKQLVNTVFGDFYPTYNEEWTQIKKTFTYDGLDKYGRKLPVNNVQFSLTPNPNVWADPVLVSYFDDFSLVRHGDVKGESGRLPETFTWEDDPIPKPKTVNNVNFNDIKNNWAETTIQALAESGIVNGTSNETFEPNKNVTRAEMYALLIKYMNIKRRTKNIGFSDVKNDDWYSDYIAYAHDIGLIPEKLIDGNKFYPNKELTRGEMAGIIASYIVAVDVKSDSAGNINFKDDGELGIWRDEIGKATDYGIIKGYPDGYFCPDKKVTRAETAEMIKRITELNGRKYFYVDYKNGNDKNDGTEHSPFKSIYRAQEAVRENNSDMNSNIYVFLKSGMHFMNKTLSLTNADSGTNGYNVIYKSYGDGKALLSGGKPQVYDWEMHDNDKGIYRTRVGNINTRQLYVNGVRAIRARSEEKLENYTVDLNSDYQAITKSKWIANLSDIKNVEIVHNGTYYCNYRVLIDDIQEYGDNVKIKYNDAFVKNSRTESNIYFNLNLWVENAYELLDNEGEWFLDKTEGYLYYKPRAWEDLKTAEFTLPTTETLIDGNGIITDDKYEPIHNIIFDSIGFGYTAGVKQFDERGGLPLCQDALLLPRLDSRPSDSGYKDIEIITAATQFNNVSYLNFTDCTWKKTGNAGLNIIGGIQHTSVNANEFYDITSNAMQIGNPANSSSNTDSHAVNESFPFDKRYYKADINITNNYIHDTAVEFLSAGAMAITNLQYSKVQNNEIFRTSYSGIHSGYGFSARPFNLYYKTSIDHNYIHKTNLLKYSMNDGGAVYHMSTAYGDPRDAKTMNGRNKISYNYCEDQGGSINNIYLDDGAGWMEISHNVFNTHWDYWPYGVMTTGNNAKCNIVTDNYIRDDSVTVAGIKQEPFTKWYEKTKGVINDNDLRQPEMTTIGPEYLIRENMEDWDDGAKEIVRNAGITDKYISKFHEEFQDYKIDYPDYGYYSTDHNSRPYLPGVYDIETGEERTIDISATNRKGTTGTITPDRIQLLNKTPDIVRVTDYNKVQGLKPGKGELEVRILCGRNKDVVDTYPVEVYVDDEIECFPNSTVPIIYINGSGGEVKALTGDNIPIDLNFQTKFGRRLRAHEYKITSSDESIAQIDENGDFKGLTAGKGELTIDMVWGGNNKHRQYKKDFMVTNNEMYDDFDKSQIIEADDDFVNLNNWKYFNQGTSDVAEQLSDGMKIASKNIVFYDKEKIVNKLLHFRLKIAGNGGWPSFALNCGDNASDLNNEYVFTIYERCFELQRFNNQKRTVLWGNGNMWDGTYPLYGGRPGSNIVFNKEYDVGIGAFDVPEGVRIVCYMDGLKVFDQIDYVNKEDKGIKNEPVLNGGGYFGIHMTNLPEYFEIHKPVVK